MTDRTVPFSDMSPRGQAMFRDNFFHAIAVDLHCSAFYRLSNFENKRFHALARFQSSYQPLLNLSPDWEAFLREVQDKLYSLHEGLRGLVATWEEFANKKSNDLLGVVLRMSEKTDERASLFNKLREFHEEILREAPERRAKTFTRAVQNLVGQEGELVGILEDLSLARVVEAAKLFDRKELSLEFVGSRESERGSNTLDRLLQKNVIHVTDLPAVYFSEAAPQYPVRWDFSSKKGLIQSFLDVSGKTEKDISYLTERKDVKKHDLAKDLFALMVDMDALMKRVGERICLYFEKGEDTFEPHPGIPLSPDQFWPLSMNLSLTYESKDFDFLIFEVVDQRKNILIPYLNRSVQNKGQFLAYVNPVL